MTLSTFEVILHQPEIPPNTGNIMRLCANTGARLHLVEPLGFSLEEKALRRAGLDYRDQAVIRTWPSLDDCLLHVLQGANTRPSDRTLSSEASDAASGRSAPERSPRLFICTTQGEHIHSDAEFARGDVFLFGSESSGLPSGVHTDPRVHARLRLPMQADSRSLNLANSVAVMIYEAWRQIAYATAQKA